MASRKFCSSRPRRMRMVQWFLDGSQSEILRAQATGRLGPFYVGPYQTGVREAGWEAMAHSHERRAVNVGDCSPAWLVTVEMIC